MLTSSALMLGGLGCAVAALRCTAAASAAATATAGVVLAGSLAIAATWAYSILLVAPTITAALLRLGGVLAAGVAACALTMREGGPLSVLVGLGLAAACGGPVVFFIAVVLVAREANAFHAAIARVHTLQLRSARGSPPASA